MKEFAFTCQLKNDDEIVEKYCTYHEAVWPEVLASLQNVGIVSGRIFRSGRRLFMLIRTTDEYEPESSMTAHWNSHPRVREWEELMRSFQERPPDAGEGDGAWVPMERVWALD